MPRGLLLLRRAPRPLVATMLHLSVISCFDDLTNAWRCSATRAAVPRQRSWLAPSCRAKCPASWSCGAATSTRATRRQPSPLPTRPPTPTSSLTSTSRSRRRPSSWPLATERCLRTGTCRRSSASMMTSSKGCASRRRAARTRLRQKLSQRRRRRARSWRKLLLNQRPRNQSTSPRSWPTKILLNRNRRRRRKHRWRQSQSQSQRRRQRPNPRRRRRTWRRSPRRTTTTRPPSSLRSSTWKSLTGVTIKHTIVGERGGSRFGEARASNGNGGLARLDCRREERGHVLARREQAAGHVARQGQAVAGWPDSGADCCCKHNGGNL
mmetsp:Transcript_25323/g.58324  ORF Transcript_25323/g.58324 Transcript_25323/m.58324 type:complete len:323 (-) Transcript_25323:1280-2248(-)